VPRAVEEVDDEPRQHPDQEPQPRLTGEVEHQEQAGQHGQGGQHRAERHPEGPRQVRPSPAENDDADRDQHEGEQRPDVDQLGQCLERDEAGEDRHDDADTDRDPVRRNPRGMDLGQPDGQQPVPAHGKRHPGLSEHQDQHD